MPEVSRESHKRYTTLLRFLFPVHMQGNKLCSLPNPFTHLDPSHLSLLLLFSERTLAENYNVSHIKHATPFHKRSLLTRIFICLYINSCALKINQTLIFTRDTGMHSCIKIVIFQNGEGRLHSASLHYWHIH